MYKMMYSDNFLERSVTCVKVVFLYEARTTETHSWMLIGEGVATVIENHHVHLEEPC